MWTLLSPSGIYEDTSQPNCQSLGTGNTCPPILDDILIQSPSEKNSLETLYLEDSIYRSLAS